MKTITSSLLVLCMCVVSSVLAQIPRTISYQGQILANGKPISDGLHQIAVALYDSISGGTPLFSELQNTNVASGIYSLQIGSVTAIPLSLDFDRIYYLGVSIDGSPELAPRTALTSVPYSINAAFADVAHNVSPDAKGIVTSINEVSGMIRIVGDSTVTVIQNGGTITLHSYAMGSGGGGIQGIQSPQKTISVIYPNGPAVSLDIRDSSITSRKIADDAITMSKLNESNASYGQVIKWNGSAWAPANESSSSGGTSWQLGGNGGTINGTDFIGTTDNQGLDFRTNNNLQLRLNPNSSIQRDDQGNTRGSEAIDLQIVRTSATQVASGVGSVIGGGDYNTASGTNAVVGGGVTNASGGSYSTVSGGGNNAATDVFTTIGGGGHNSASAGYATIGGGETNVASGSSSTVSGGVADTATAYSATIGGGANNVAKGISSTIAGGTSNLIGNNYYSSIGGGYFNTILSGDVSVIGGGANNRISATSSAIGGGLNNYLGGDGSVIPGGAYLRMTGNNSFGFNGGNTSADSAVITSPKVAYFGNVDLWIGSTDSTTHGLRLYEVQNGGITYPGANTNYTGFKAGSQSSNINYILPTSAPTVNGSLLSSSSAGQWSWSSTAVWDAANSRFGANTTTPNTTIDANGDLAVREHPIVLANGANNNIIIGNYSFVQITGPNGAFSVTGITGGNSGKIVVLYNSTGQAMTLTNNDNNSLAGNRIFTGSGGVYTTPNGYVFDVVTLMYSSSKNGWIVVSHN